MKKSHWLFLPLFILLLANINAQVQNNNLLLPQNDDVVKINPVTNQRNTAKFHFTNYVAIQPDTLKVKHLLYLLSEQGIRNAYLNLDSVQNYVYTGLRICDSIDYYLGRRRLLENLFWAHFIKADYDSAKYFSMILEKDANEKCNTLRRWMWNMYMGWAFHAESNWDSAIVRYNRSYAFVKELKDTLRMKSDMQSLAQIYYKKGDYAESVRICYEMINGALGKLNARDSLNNLGQLAAIYSDLKLHDRQMELIHSVLNKYSNSVDSNILLNVYYMALGGYENIKKYDSVFYYARQINPLTQLGNLYPNGWVAMAQSFLALGQLDSAQYYFSATLNVVKRLDMPVNPKIYHGLGQIAFKRNDYKKALSLYKLSENLIQENDKINNREIYKTLHEYYESVGNFKLSLAYLKKFQVLEDSAINVKKSIDVVLSGIDAEKIKMSNAIHQLAQENKIQTLLITKQKQQKNMTYGGLGVLMIAGGMGFYRFRRNKELKNKQALLNERLRISRDLHDEVGATLSGIAMYSHLAKDQIKGSQLTDVEDSLSIIQESSGEMVGKLSDIVWLLNPGHDTLKQLLDKLEDYAKRLAPINSLKVKTDFPYQLEDIHLTMEERRNIYLICKEAIINSIKYSRASVLTIQVRNGGRQITFIIADNGDGFDKGQFNKGNGLSNMEQRAQAIGADFTLISNPDEGTKVELVCNLIQ